MTIAELISLLEQYEPDAEVRLAHQPEYPFEYGITGVASMNDLRAMHYEYEDSPDFNGEPAPENRVFILEGAQLKYGSRDMWDSLA